MLTGDKAKKVLDLILIDRQHRDIKYGEPYVAGYYKAGYSKGGTVIVAFDNTSGNCWVEEFTTEQEAIDFCK